MFKSVKKLIYDRTMLKAILILAWPTVLEQALQTGIQYINTAMVGSIGAQASAAIGLTTSVVWLMISTFSALGMGVLSVVAKAAGAKDFEKTKAAYTQSIILTLISGLIMSAIALGISPFLPGWLGAGEEIKKDAFLYFSITSIPMIFRAGAIIFGSVLRATGNTKTPMQVTSLTIICNIILNYLLINPSHELFIGPVSITIWGAGLGVLGSAIAASICFALNGILMFVAFCKSPYFSIRHTKIRLDKPVMGECLRIGLPITAQRVIICLGFVVFTALITKLGTIAIATHSIAIIAEEAFYIPGFGMQAAAATLAGNAVGEKNAQKLRHISLIINLMAMFVMTMLSVLLFIFPDTVMSFFTKDAQVISGGASILRIVAVSEPLFAVAIIMEGVFAGIGDVKAPFFIAVLSMWGIRILATFLCVTYFGLGLNAVWICMVGDNTVRCILLSIRFFKRNWNSYIDNISSCSDINSCNNINSCL